MSTRSTVQAESTEQSVLQVLSGALQDLGMCMLQQARVAWLGKRAAMPATVFSFLPPSAQLHSGLSGVRSELYKILFSTRWHLVVPGLTLADHLPLF